MTIKRQYSLPNCKLILEGIGDEGGAIARSSLSMVMNVECYFVGHDQPLTGGHDFLSSLVSSVSTYAQSFLSGVHPVAHQNGKTDLVHVKQLSEDVHRLVVYPSAVPDQNSHPSSIEPIHIDLKTVQLFDLVEALDQLCADGQTLPELSLKLQPVARRYRVSEEPVAKRVVPAALGISSLAVAAGLLFMVPTPPVRRPEPAETSTTSEESPAASPTATGSPDPSDATSSPAATESPIASPTSTPAASPSPTDANSPEADAPAATTDIDSLLNSAAIITAPDQLNQLKRSLRDKLDEAWQIKPTFTEDLEYRVAVSEEGDILGVRYVNDAASTYRKDVPLLDLLYTPTEAVRRERIADFRVVFTAVGEVQVSPWHGIVDSSTPSPSP